LIFLSLTNIAFSQRLTVKGVVSDSTSKPVEYATVTLLRASDSSLATFGRTMENGSFTVGNVPADNYILKISFIGYKTHQQKIDKSQSGTVDLGKIIMEEASAMMQEITIKGERAPVSFKKDTIEFNADAFKTMPNANVEDLLKKMPGIEIDKDGNIMVNGERVQKITVNGKAFFGTDPKIATQNLASKAIDKIQVFDKKSDMTEFSGIDDGQREKTINLELKEDFKNSSFGSVTGGIGTDEERERWDNKISYNRFSTKQQFSVLGQANNVNKQGFSFQDIANFTGNSQRMMSGGRVDFSSVQNTGAQFSNRGQNYGFMSNIAGGLNYNRQFSKKSDLQSSYFYNHMNRDMNQVTERINFLPNGSFNLNQSNDQNTLNSNHRVNAVFEHKIDSANNLKITANGGFTQNQVYNNSNSATFASDGTKQNDSERRSVNNSDNINFTGTALYRHRFKKKGRFISFNTVLSYNDTKSDGTLNSVNNFYGDTLRKQLINQVNAQTNTAKSFNGSISHTEPVGRRKYLEINYNFLYTNNKVNREVFDVTDSERIFNRQLSNNYTTDYLFHRPGINYKWNGKKKSVTAGVSLQNSTLTGNLPLFNTQINRQFTNVLPVLRFKYDPTQTKGLEVNYETAVNEPSVSQLQPVIDNSDPLNINMGNPDLKPEYAHRFNATFRTFDPVKFFSFFVGANANYTTNKILYGQFIDNKFIRTVKPVNVDNDFNAGLNSFMSFPIKAISSRMNFGTGYTFNRAINILNNVETFTFSHSIRGNARYQLNIKEFLEWSVRANISRQMSIFEAENAKDQIFDNITYGTDIEVKLPKDFVFESRLDYWIYKSPTTGFKQELPLLNASLSKLIFKDKSGEIKLAVVNLLNTKVGVEQQTSANFLSNSTIMTLGRYTMFSFTYNLNKALNPASGMRGRGRHMMF
jgi:hypothetical protein